MFLDDIEHFLCLCCIDRVLSVLGAVSCNVELNTYIFQNPSLKLEN